MITLRSHFLFSVSALVVAAGLLCLNLHDVTHVKSSHTSSDHTDTSDEKAPFPDECTLCIVSAFGFAEPEDCRFIPVHSDKEQLQALSFFIRIEQFDSNSAQRAPPIS